jgi:ABC-2 type transport system permease protein
MISRRLYWFVCVFLPLFCVFFMSTIFGSGQMEDIPVGVVDLDNTATSRQIIRHVEASPTLKITAHYATAAQARVATQRKEIYGYLIVPPNFEQCVMTSNNATLNYYYHYALLSVGSEILNAFESVLEPIALSPIVMQATSMGVEEEQTVSFLVPVTAQSHPLNNPDLDYAVYLSNPFFFILLQVLVLLVTTYTLGSEVKFKTYASWFEAADDTIFIAVVAKLLPYTVIFSLMAVLGNYVMFGVMDIPFACSMWALNGTAVLFIVATQALGVWLFSLFPAMGIIISIISMVGSLGATLSGVTFPTESMYPVVHAASYLLPVRHFVEINQNLLYGDYGFAYTWEHVAILLGYLLLALTLLPHLHRAIKSKKYEDID